MVLAFAPTTHSAPGQYLGYALQPVRLCYHLMTCPQGAHVSLEHLDDVAVHGPDGSILFEQCKSALRQNPLSNWAPDFWKTIAHWIDALAQVPVSADKANFQLYVAPVHSGAWAQALSDATTTEAVEAVVEIIRRKLCRRTKPPTCFPHLQRFLDATPDERAAVITRMTVVSADEDPVQPLRARLELTVAPEMLDTICQAAIGIAKQQADGLIASGKPAMLEADSFRRALRAFIQRNNLPALLTSFSTTPPPAQIASLLANRPTFIRQLELIEASDDERVRAVSDFLRTSADKAIWAEKGLVFEQGLDEWDNGLVYRHTAIAGEVSDIHSDKPPQIRGRLAYRQCSRLEIPLDGRAVPLHFVHGSFNTLADDRRLGWHPDYQTLLGETEAL